MSGVREHWSGRSRAVIPAEMISAGMPVVRLMAAGAMSTCPLESAKIRNCWKVTSACQSSASVPSYIDRKTLVNISPAPEFFQAAEDSDRLDPPHSSDCEIDMKGRPAGVKALPRYAPAPRQCECPPRVGTLCEGWTRASAERRQRSDQPGAAIHARILPATATAPGHRNGPEEWQLRVPLRYPCSAVRSQTSASYRRLAVPPAGRRCFRGLADASVSLRRSYATIRNEGLKISAPIPHQALAELFPVEAIARPEGAPVPESLAGNAENQRRLALIDQIVRTQMGWLRSGTGRHIARTLHHVVAP